MKILKIISQILAGHTSVFVIAAAIFAFFHPSFFAWVQRGNTASIILGITMFSMGCTLSTEDFRILFRRPLDIGIGALAQYTIMPLVAWTLSRLFHLDPFMSAGLILVGCCPGGVSSNIMSYLCHGDVAYSVGMTAVSTLLSPFVTPVLVLLLAGTSIEIDAWGMFRNILIVTLLPVFLGCMFNYFMGGRKYFSDIQSLMPGVGVLCLVSIVGGVICQVRPQLLQQGISLVLLTLLVVFLHNGLGYLLGYMIGFLCSFSKAKKRTLSIEIGMQNAGMATVLSRSFLATPAAVAANPMAALSIIPCALSCACHSISGTLLAGYFLWLDNKKSSCHSS